MPENLKQPEDIPWQLMCTSQDMMDPSFCNKKFPFPWRSSIAISAYEVPEEDLPSPFCNGRLTYLKVTLSLTGYQPTDAEIAKGYTEFGNTPVEAGLDEIFGEYFGCYGALLNIGIFPNSASTWNVPDYPKIIAMEPKVRELIQTATESGEILTASKEELNLGKSFTNTQSQKTGISGKAGAKFKVKEVDVNTELGFTHEWGSTTEDKDLTNIDYSTEKAESRSNSTNLNQLYNFLTAYHKGTNRGLFLMLPRPHILQPTNRRTFVQGIRSIEGIQEFFLAVVRPLSMEGICVETRLDTGHFPENIEVATPPVVYDESDVDFVLRKYARNGRPWGAETTFLTSTFTLPSGWVADKRTQPPPVFPKGDSGHIAVSETDIGSNSQATPVNYNYQVVGDSLLMISGHIVGASWFGPGAHFNKMYRVFLRSKDPKTPPIGDSTNIGQLFITSRNLCCCFYNHSSQPCLIRGAAPEAPPTPSPVDTADSKIIEQRDIKIAASLLADSMVEQSLDPALKGLLLQLKEIMTSSRDGRFSHTEDGISFLQSDYFVRKILKLFPDEIKNTLLNEVTGLSIDVVESFDTGATVNDALSLSLADFRLKTKLNTIDSLEQRQILIDLVQDDD